VLLYVILITGGFYPLRPHYAFSGLVLFFKFEQKLIIKIMSEANGLNEVNAPSSTNIFLKLLTFH